MLKKIGVVLLVLLLAGCQKQDAETKNVLMETNEGSYTYLIPFKATDTRNYHSTYQSRYDINEIGAGLEEYSHAYFSTEDYYAQEGQIINRSILSDLVGRESDTNPQGLNPAKGSEFMISDSRSLVDAVIVTDVFELDFVKKTGSLDEVSGITLAIVVNQEQSVNGSTYRIKEDRLWDYATNAGRKLESYLRTLQSVENTPILLLIYNSVSSDAMLPGGFMGYGYFTGRSGQFVAISEKWVLIPTSEASSLDSETYNQFLNFKSALKEYLPENIGVVGTAKYENDNIRYLRIHVNIQTKTYAEVKSLTQYCAQLTNNFSSTNMRLLVHILSNDESFALIERKENERDVSITYVY